MHKQNKILLTVVTLMVSGGLVALIYFKFHNLSAYKYTTPKGQQYSIKYFPKARIIDSSELAKTTNNSEVKAGTPMLVSYIEDGLGVATYISGPLSRPLTKTCTDKESLAFNIDNYEVCKDGRNGKTNMIIAKLGKRGKYYMVVSSTVYDGKRITEQKDNEYITRFQNFNLLDYRDKFEEIYRSIEPTI